MEKRDQEPIKNNVLKLVEKRFKNLIEECKGLFGGIDGAFHITIKNNHIYLNTDFTNEDYGENLKEHYYKDNLDNYMTNGVNLNLKITTVAHTINRLLITDYNINTEFETNVYNEIFFKFLMNLFIIKYDKLTNAYIKLHLLYNIDYIDIINFFKNLENIREIYETIM